MVIEFLIENNLFSVKYRTKSNTQVLYCRDVKPNDTFNSLINEFNQTVNIENIK